MKKHLLTTTFLIGLTLAATAQTKTIQIRLNGIFMGECGNNNHCPHEPVAGEIQLYLASMFNNDVLMIPPVHQPQNAVIWENPNYQLVCSNKRASSSGGNGTSPGAAEDIYSSFNQTPIANNIRKTFSFQVSEQDWQTKKYQMRLKLRLGNKHQDNFMASVGEHWTDTEFPTFDFQSSQYTSEYSYLKTFGPFETYSDRCHEYWVQFKIDVN